MLFSRSKGKKRSHPKKKNRQTEDWFIVLYIYIYSWYVKLVLCMLGILVLNLE